MLAPSIKLHGNSDLRVTIFLRQKPVKYLSIIDRYQLSNELEFS
jgi:hypothetical protein